MTIYVTEGYDEVLVGTRNQIIEHIKDQAGMFVSVSTFNVITVRKCEERQTDVDSYPDPAYIIELTPATVLHDIGSNDDVVGMGFSSAAYDHPKPLSIDEMVIGDIYVIKNPRYEFDHGFFEYVGSSKKREGSALFIKTRTQEFCSRRISDVEKADLSLNIDGIDCDLELGEYEEVMNILKRRRGKS